MWISSSLNYNKNSRSKTQIIYSPTQLLLSRWNGKKEAQKSCREGRKNNKINCWIGCAQYVNQALGDHADWISLSLTFVFLIFSSTIIIFSPFPRCVPLPPVVSVCMWSNKNKASKLINYRNAKCLKTRGKHGNGNSCNVLYYLQAYLMQQWVNWQRIREVSIAFEFN